MKKMKKEGAHSSGGSHARGMLHKNSKPHGGVHVEAHDGGRVKEFGTSFAAVPRDGTKHGRHDPGGN